jgi:putative tryptophan/tyrosine transport system substrate-binding protein
MKRRRAIASAGAILVGPAVVRGQTQQRQRRVGMFLDLPAVDARAQARLAAFAQGLQEAGWTIGRNMRVEYRWRVEGEAALRASAQELADFAPEVVLGSSTPVTAMLRQVMPHTPIVFVAVIDPVGAGFVESFGRPGGNITGFSTIDYGVSAKWVEMLKEIAPTLARVAVLADPGLQSTRGQVDNIAAAAAKLGLSIVPVDLRDGSTVEREIAAFAAVPEGGIVATASPLTGLHRDLIIRLAAAHRLPAIYPYDHFAPAGGLIAFGPDLVEPFRNAAGYIDRILRGARPADLPVQAPSKIDLTINLRTARSLGLTIPPSLLLRAEEVIE